MSRTWGVHHGCDDEEERETKRDRAYEISVSIEIAEYRKA